MKKFKKSRILPALLSFLLVINIILSAPLLVAAAATNMDANNKSTLNLPQSITGKAELATWSFGNTKPLTEPNFVAVSGYYTTTPAGVNSTLQVFKNSPATQTTTGFS